MNTTPVRNHVIQTTRIIIGPHCLAEVDASVEPLLRGVLGHDDIEFASQDGRLEYRWGRRAVFQKTGANRLVFPVGCLQRVFNTLCEAGHHCEIQDCRNLGESLRVDRSDAAEAEQSCKGITACLDRHSEGLLRIARGRPRARAIGAICRLLPEARVFVAGATRRVLQETATELGHFVGGEVQVVQGGNWRSSCRVVCGTFTSFDRAQASDWDVLIFGDAFEALGKRVHQNRGAFGRHRVYAFLDPAVRLSRKQELELEVLAGPIIHSARSLKRRRELKLEVAFASAPSEYLPRLNTPRERRERLWAAPRRNSAVASLADALADRDAALLWDYGLFLHDDDPFCRWVGQPRVTVLVESARHADALAQLLPSWKIMDRRAGQATLASAGDVWSQWSVPHCSIMTAVRAAEYRRFDADVIVSAAGGSAPQLPVGLARHGGHVLVIDFDDQGDRFLCQDTECRRHGYDKLLQSEAIL